LFSHLLHLPVHFFRQQSSGSLLAHLTYYTDQLANTATRVITTLIQESATVIGLLALMFYRSWQLTLGVLIIVPVLTLVVIYATRRLRRLSHQVQSSMGEVTQIGNELIRGYKVVRMFGGEQYEQQRFQGANEHNMALEMKRMVTELLSAPIVQFLVALALAAIIWLATRDATLSRLSPGTFMSFMMAMILLLAPVRNLTQLNAQLQKAIAAGESIFSLLDQPPEQDSGTRTLTRVCGEFQLTRLGFHYPGNDRPILQDISMTIRPGQKVALVGKSGSGKTTLVNLLVRFHDYSQGEIRLDGIPLPDIRLADLRHQFAYVGQEIVLFNDTLRNNIAYGALRTASLEQVTAVAG
ncbi:MAG: ATP-binding cassette domain-containing protein, partial [Thiothrix sp.]|nr:ATP-binding cassette domain-containing protein [Thiothrix sp.]